MLDALPQLSAAMTNWLPREGSAGPLSPCLPPLGPPQPPPRLLGPVPCGCQHSFLGKGLAEQQPHSWDRVRDRKACWGAESDPTVSAWDQMWRPQPSPLVTPPASVGHPSRSFHPTFQTSAPLSLPGPPSQQRQPRKGSACILWVTVWTPVGIWASAALLEGRLGNICPRPAPGVLPLKRSHSECQPWPYLERQCKHQQLCPRKRIYTGRGPCSDTLLSDNRSQINKQSDNG